MNVKRYALLTVREGAKNPSHYYAHLDDIQAMVQLTETDYELKKNDVLHEIELVESTKLPSTAQYII